MQGMDGFTAAEEIRKVDPMVKVIFITGYELDDSARKALQAGAYTALNKPVDPQKILTLIKSISTEQPGNDPQELLALMQSAAQ